MPVKFPLLLAQGVEGIAVGLSTKILPHNFCELIKASIDVLKGKNPKIYPDFFTGGIADFSEYNQGLRGGKIKVRARIDILDKKTLVIKEIPFSTTTTSLMESIVKASEKGQIKVKQVIDNTAKDVEIQILASTLVSLPRLPLMRYMHSQTVKSAFRLTPALSLRTSHSSLPSARS